MLSILHSNRLDALADALLARSEVPADPFDLRPEVVVVPASGVARWLKYRVAQERGVCANLECAFPAEFAWRLIGQLVPGVPERSPFDTRVLAWRFHDIAARLPDRPELAPLSAWVAAADEARRMQLAERLAGLYDRYLSHRPDWLTAWGEGRLLNLDPLHEPWQAWLWREVLGEIGGEFRQHPKEALFAALTEPGAAARLPARLLVLAVPLLPPLYLEIFLHLARVIPVDLHFLNPCREYWADLVSERELALLRLKGDEQAEFSQVGHPLLASWGRQSRDHLALTLALPDSAGVEVDEAFVEPAGDGLLSRLQASILNLADPEGALALATGDASLQAHVCHSATRELEVLHDELWALFDARPDLAPADVLVMTPDLDALAPAVDAVFGAAPRERHIPWAVSGRARPGDTPLIRAFLALGALPASRFDAPTVLDIISAPPLARRFGLAEADLALASEWLSEAGARWGLDADHRAALDLPADSRHTWAEALARLTLGYALPAGGLAAPAGILPWEELEGGAAVLLGRLMRVLRELADLAAGLATDRDPAAWQAFLSGQMARFLDPDEAEAEEAARLREALADLAASAGLAGYKRPIPAALAFRLVQQRLEAGAPGGVPTGAVTFTRMGPLRGLPYRVVCLLGMNDGAFPRNPSPVEFDLAAARPRLGDRSVRDEDRGALLDALMAAGEVFYLSWTGRDLRSDQDIPPAVPVAELLDWLGRWVEGGADVVQRGVVRRHPMQAFSPRNFDAAAPASYAVEHLEAACLTALPPAARPGVPAPFAASLPEPEPRWRELSPDTLYQFLRQPAQFLLTRRLGVRVEDGEGEIPGEEPFALDRPGGWSLRDRLLELSAAGLPPDALRELARAAPELPHGPPGDVALDEALRQALAVRATLDALGPPAEPEPLALRLEVAGFTIAGFLPGVVGGMHYGWRGARCSATDTVKAWVSHLLVNCQKPGTRGRWITEDRVLELAPPEHPEALLADLLALYWGGLTAPLWLPKKAALAWLTGGPSKAELAWEGGEFTRAERDEVWWRLALGEARARLPADFGDLAERAYGPLVRHLEDLPVADALERAGR